MKYSEDAVVFSCASETLIGVIALPERPSGVGVMIVVGGPQYRAGSHRQFVLLSRFLAERGVVCMRFDYRGMGDSTGGTRDFRDVDGDIAAAVDKLFALAPTLDGVVLWGLCDGASASCFYVPNDSRVVGAVLVNPWVRTEAGEAQTYLKHYYRQRLTDPRFWKKLVGGRVSLRASVASLLAMAGRARSGAPRANSASAAPPDLPNRMSASLEKAKIPFAIVLSGNDYVAKEFELETRKRPAWRTLLGDRRRAEVVTFASADHTFSSEEKREAVAVATWNWLVRRNFCRGSTETAG
ncbi:hydrolase 1, exosortase A system-associated [Azoarcus sp. PA01]|nr:hydrolase 1, exosortase A system-associated [Azoarcus sp. PA01]